MAEPAAVVAPSGATAPQGRPVTGVGSGGVTHGRLRSPPAHRPYRLTIGSRRSFPKPLGVMRGPGADWRRLYSARSTSRTTRSTISAVVAGSHDVLGGQVLLDVELEDGIEHLVRREALVVALVGPQLGRRRLEQHALGDDLAAGPLVAVPAEAYTRSLATSLITA